MNEKMEVREVKLLAQSYIEINLQSQGLTSRLKAISVVDRVSHEGKWNVIPWFLNYEISFFPQKHAKINPAPKQCQQRGHEQKLKQLCLDLF